MDLSERIAKSEVSFCAGFNCAQVVLASFSDLSPIELSYLYKISQGFGGGMGKKSVCGALTGGYMAIGLAYGKSIENEADAKIKTQACVELLDDGFQKMFGKGLHCSELLTDDIAEESRKAHCQRYVTYVIGEVVHMIE